MDKWLTRSAVLFRFALALVTFEQVRPFGYMLSDWFFLAALLIVPKHTLRLKEHPGSMGPVIPILVGALLSLHDSLALSSLPKLLILFVLLAPLSIAHSASIRENLYFLLGGISLNCFITVLQASAFPGIVEALSINPPQVDVSVSGRFQGLTEFPVTLGLIGGFGALIAIGLLLYERRRAIRWILYILTFVCSVAAILSGSRTFFSCLIPGLLLLAFLDKERRKSLLYVPFGVIVLYASLVYLSPTAMSRYSERIGDVGLVDYGRLATMGQIALEISQKPLLGWGVDHFDEGGVIRLPDSDEIAGAHNTPLRYWYSAGLLGILGILGLFAIPVLRLGRALKLGATDANSLRLVLALCLFLFLASNLSPYIYNRYLYVPMFIFSGVAAAFPVFRQSVLAMAAKPLLIFLIAVFVTIVLTFEFIRLIFSPHY